MRDDRHKQGVLRALGRFAASAPQKRKVCDCGLEFEDKAAYYRHKNGRNCLAKEPERVMPKQLNLFGGR